MNEVFKIVLRGMLMIRVEAISASSPVKYNDERNVMMVVVATPRRSSSWHPRVFTVMGTT